MYNRTIAEIKMEIRAHRIAVSLMNKESRPLLSESVEFKYDKASTLISLARLEMELEYRKFDSTYQDLADRIEAYDTEVTYEETLDSFYDYTDSIDTLVRSLRRDLI